MGKFAVKLFESPWLLQQMMKLPEHDNNSQINPHLSSINFGTFRCSILFIASQTLSVFSYLPNCNALEGLCI